MRIISKKTFFFLIFPSVVLFICFFIYFVLTSNAQINSNLYYKISSLKYDEITTIIQKEKFANFNTKSIIKLLAGRKIEGVFFGKVDNLGIIGIPFDTHNKSVNDQIIFRLKESSKKDWFFQATYNADQIQNNVPFPFGFPVIENSRNASFTFEIESLAGKANDSLSLDRVNGYFLAKYKFSKSELLRNPYILLQFFIVKIVSSIPLLAIGQLFFILFISLLISLLPYIIAIFWKKLINYIIKLNFSRSILNNSVTIFIILLFVIIATSTFYNYANAPSTYSTESRFHADVGNDFYLGVQYRASQMIKGQKMDLTVLLPNYHDPTGQTLPLLFSPFLIINPNRYVAYFFFICMSIVFFTLFTIILLKKANKEIRDGALIFLIAFFISEPGLLGIHTGNVDIILGPLVGIFILWFFHLLNKKSISIIQAICFGVCAGGLLNIKLTILPLILLTILFVKRRFLILALLIMTFLTLIYVPNIFGSESSLEYHLSNVMGAYDMYSHLKLGNLIWGNHSLVDISSFFSRCLELNTCETQHVNGYISSILFILTFITPFLLVKPLNLIVVAKKNVYSILKALNSKETALVLFVFSIGLINLSFNTAAYDYRLYLSVPITLIVLKESQKIINALIYCYLSMFSLLLGGCGLCRCFQANLGLSIQD